jgi:hypothetical protein
MHSLQVRKIRFPVSRPDDVSSRPDSQLSKALAVRRTCQIVRTHIKLKHHWSGRSGFPPGHSFVSRSFELLQLASVRTIQQPIRTTLSVRSSFRISFQTQIWEDCCNRPDDVDSRTDTRASDMEIACIRTTVWTTIFLVQTREAFIWKLLAADVRPFVR